MPSPITVPPDLSSNAIPLDPSSNAVPQTPSSNASPQTPSSNAVPPPLSPVSPVSPPPSLSPPSSPLSPSPLSTLSPSSNAVPPAPSSNAVAVGYSVVSQQYVDASGVVITETQFTTIDASSDVQIIEDLSGAAAVYYDDTHESGKAAILAQIQEYASQIQCEKFQGKGTIDDYSALFQAAAQIANESAQMNLDVDIQRFNEFASAAEDLSALFSSFIIKLENVSIIDDTAFLTAISVALGKICNLSKVFGKFKETILATSTVSLPKSAHDTSVILQNVSSNINCAMTYINHFVDSSSPAPSSADLSPEEKGIIDGAITTINNWNILCDQGVSIAMSNNPDIQFITGTSTQLKTKAQALTTATNLLRTKLSAFRTC